MINLTQSLKSITLNFQNFLNSYYLKNILRANKVILLGLFLFINFSRNITFLRMIFGAICILYSDPYKIVIKLFGKHEKCFKIILVGKKYF